MANLTENTQYDPAAGEVNTIAPPSAQTPSIASAIPTPPPTTAVPPTSNPSSQFPDFFQGAPTSANPDASFNSQQGLQNDVYSGQETFPIGKPIGQTSGPNQPVDPNSQFVPTDTSDGSNPEWVYPSSNVEYVNWPSSLGGGQQLMDPSQPGRTIRAVQQDNTDDDILMRGGLSPLNYKISPIIPLWAGGSDTIANKEVLPVSSFNRKQSIEGVALTLLTAGDITMSQAQVLARNYKSFNATGLPKADTYGLVPLSIAQQYYNKWTNPQDINAGDVANQIIPTIQKFPGLPGVAQSAIGGFASGLTGGWIPNTQSGTAAGIGNAVSDWVGSTGGSIAAITGINAAIEGLLGLAAPETLGASELGNVAIPGVDAGVEAALDGGWFSKIAEPIQNMAQKLLPGVFGAAEDAGGVAVDTGDASVENAQKLLRNGTFSKILRAALPLQIYGLLSKQQQNTFTGRAKQFMFDTMFGGLLGGVGELGEEGSLRNLPGVKHVPDIIKNNPSIGIGAGTMLLSLMQGDNIQNAFINSATMVGLHAISPAEAQGNLQDIQNNEVTKGALATLNQYVGNDIPTVPKGGQVPADLKLDPQTIQQAKEAAMTSLNQLAINNGMSAEDLETQKARITAAATHLYNLTLPEDERATKTAQDLTSVGELMKNRGNLTSISTPSYLPEYMQSMPMNMDDQYSGNQPDTDNPTGYVPATGVASTLDDGKTQRNIQIFNRARQSGLASNRVFLVDRPDIEPTIRGIRQSATPEQIKKGLIDPNMNTAANAQIYGMITDPTGKRTLLPLGWTPTERTIEGKPVGAYNDNYDKSVQAMRNAIEKNPNDTTKIKQELGRHPAKIPVSNLSDAQIQYLSDHSKSMSDDELVNTLKPSDPLRRYDKNFNASTITQAMRKEGLKVLTADISKSNVESPGTTKIPGFPGSRQPNLEMNIGDKNWKESKDIKNGTPSDPTTPTSISSVLNSLKNSKNADSFSKTVGDIKSKVKQTSDADQLLQAADMPNTDVSKTAVESVLTTFKDGMKTGDPQKLAETVNKVYGPVLTPEKASDLIQNKGDTNVRDVINVLHDGIVDGKASKGTEILYKSLITPFFESPEYNQTPLSTFFRETPILSKVNADAVEDNTVKKTQPLPLPENAPIENKIVNEAQKAAPTGIEADRQKYIDLDKQMRAISDKATAENRQPTPEERAQIRDLDKQSADLIKNNKNVQRPSSYSPTATANMKASMLETMITRGDDLVKNYRATRSTLGDPITMYDTLKSVSESAKLPNTGKTALSAPDYREVLNAYRDHVNQTIEDTVNETFKGNKGLNDGEPFTTLENHRAAQSEDFTRKRMTAEGATPEEINSAIEEQRNTNTERSKTAPVQKDFPSKILADKYGLKTTPGGFIVTDKSGNPSFSDEFKKTNGITTETPASYWGKRTLMNQFGKDMDIYKDSNVRYRRDFEGSLKNMANSESDYAKGLAKTVLEGIKKFMPEDSTKSFRFNNMLRSESPNSYINQLFTGTNAEGHAISQPMARILAMVKGTPADVANVDAETNATRAQEAEDKENSMGNAPGEGETTSTSGDENPEAHAALNESVGGMHIADERQESGSTKDLTRFDELTPGRLYEEITGNKASYSDGVNDGTKMLRDIISKYNKGAKTGNKIFASPEDLNNIKEAVGSKQPKAANPLEAGFVNKKALFGAAAALGIAPTLAALRAMLTSNPTYYNNQSSSQQTNKPFIAGYDLSNYAQDPTQPEHVADIYDNLTATSTDNVTDLSKYILSRYGKQSSKVTPTWAAITANSVFNASNKFGVPPKLVAAIIENDSSFGLKGVGAKTNNPGNVGNYVVNGKTHTIHYKSMQGGIDAVAEWLSNHKLPEIASSK